MGNLKEGVKPSGGISIPYTRFFIVIITADKKGIFE
jgi:hypothetical protein